MYRIVFVLFWMFLVSACSTYTTFYGDTETEFLKTENVSRLDLSNYKREIDLSKHSVLRMIDVSNYQGDLNQVFESIPKPELLEVLMLNNNQLEFLPVSVSRFKNLKQLSLNQNPRLDYQQVVKVLQQLPKIEFLNLQFNQLKEVPVVLGNVKTLEEINLSNNQLKPEAIFTPLSKLPKLRSLWLRNNKLSSLSTDVNYMSKLVNLYIESNQLNKLPKDLVGLESLRVLHLSFNTFYKLPKSLLTAPKLILLHADNCNISEIPTIFADKKSSIKGIVINNNQLFQTNIEFWKKEFDNFFLLIL